jgi:hypothetical protein
MTALSESDPGVARGCPGSTMTAALFEPFFRRLADTPAAAWAAAAAGADGGAPAPRVPRRPAGLARGAGRAAGHRARCGPARRPLPGRDAERTAEQRDAGRAAGRPRRAASLAQGPVLPAWHRHRRRVALGLEVGAARRGRRTTRRPASCSMSAAATATTAIGRSAPARHWCSASTRRSGSCSSSSP